MNNQLMFHKVMFSTRDRVMLHGSFFQLPQPKATVFCVHMMPTDRHSWQTFQEALAMVSIASLAIDLRGHGESIHRGGEILNYQRFTDADHQLYMEDVSNAIDWLFRRGVPVYSLGVIGASIGANLALHALERFQLPAAVLLSPGEEYHGVRTFEVAQRLLSQQHLLVAASSPDDQDSFQDGAQIVELASCEDKQFRPFTASGHGTNLFLQQPRFLSEVVTWFSERLVL